MGCATMPNAESGWACVLEMKAPESGWEAESPPHAPRRPPGLLKTGPYQMTLGAPGTSTVSPSFPGLYHKRGRFHAIRGHT